MDRSEQYSPWPVPGRAGPAGSGLALVGPAASGASSPGSRRASAPGSGEHVGVQEVRVLGAGRVDDDAELLGTAVTSSAMRTGGPRCRGTPSLSCAGSVNTGTNGRSRIITWRDAPALGVVGGFHGTHAALPRNPCADDAMRRRRAPAGDSVLPAPGPNADPLVSLLLMGVPSAVVCPAMLPRRRSGTERGAAAASSPPDASGVAGVGRASRPTTAPDPPGGPGAGRSTLSTWPTARRRSGPPRR